MGGGLPTYSLLQAGSDVSHLLFRVVMSAIQIVCFLATPGVVSIEEPAPLECTSIPGTL